MYPLLHYIRRLTFMTVASFVAGERLHCGAVYSTLEVAD